MSNRLKMLGLALVAAMALTGVMASGAGAVIHDPPMLTFGASPWTVSDVQEGANKFTITGQTVTCETADLNGAGTGTAPTEIALEAVYGGCKSEPLGANATISGFGKVGETNKCWYVFKANGDWELVCNGSGEVTWTMLTCQIHIPAQSVASGIDYTTGTVSGKHDLLVHFELTEIAANHTDGFLCPFSSSGMSETGVLEGTTTMRAFDSADDPTEIRWDPTTYTR